MNEGIDTNSLLLARGVGGYGSLGGYNGMTGTGTFASPSANAVRINSGNRATASGIENLLDQNQFAATNKNIVDCNARLSDAIAENDHRSTDNQFRAELRTNDRLLALQAEMNNNARVAADCCCDAKLEACKSHGELLAEIKASEGRAIERSLNAANAELTALKTQIACGCCTSAS